MELFRLILISAAGAILSGCFGNRQPSCSIANAPEVSDSVSAQITKEPFLPQSGRVLRAALAYNTPEYSVSQGNIVGFHYELLRDFAKDIEADFVLSDIRECDIAAMSLAPGCKNSDSLALSVPVFDTDIVLVTRDISDKTPAEKLRGSYAVVPRGSLEAMLLHTLRDTSCSWFFIIEDASVHGSDELVRRTAEGAIFATAAGSHISKGVIRKYPQVKCDTLQKNIPVHWGFSDVSDTLCAKFDEWLAKYGNTAYLCKKYFTTSRTESPDISPYDNIFKNEAERTNLHWKLLAAVGYAESQFCDTTISARGACGVMQIMPETAGEFGVHDCMRPDSNIYTGASYIAYLDRMFSEYVNDRDERINFVIAAYNAGPGHLFDAMRLAEAHGYSPCIWENHTETFVRLKSEPLFLNHEAVRNGYCNGKQCVDFVRKVMNTYKTYLLHKKK